MKKALFISIVVFALAGCKSLDYVRSQEPVLKSESKKSVNDLAACVSSAWSGSGGHITSLPLSGGGISIQVPQAMGGYDVVLDVTKKGDGSQFTLFERIASLTPASYEIGVKNCI